MFIFSHPVHTFMKAGVQRRQQLHSRSLTMFTSDKKRGSTSSLLITERKLDVRLENEANAHVCRTQHNTDFHTALISGRHTLKQKKVSCWMDELRKKNTLPHHNLGSDLASLVISVSNENSSPCVYSFNDVETWGGERRRHRSTGSATWLEELIWDLNSSPVEWRIFNGVERCVALLSSLSSSNPKI